MNQFIKFLILFLLIIFLVCWFFRKNIAKQKYYFLNFLSNDDFKNLKQCLQKYNVALERSKEKFYNVNRCNYKLPMDKDINNLLIKIINKIKKQTGLKNLKLYPTTGIEYRKYQAGSFMNWHQDIILTTPPQWECVFTIDNNSDSVTEFEDGEKIQSKNNSLIMVKAGGLSHRVTLTTKGERYFLKFALSDSFN